MIMGEIKRFLRDDGMIKVSRPLKELAVKAKYMQESMMHHNGAAPTISELAKALNTDCETLIMALDSVRDVESIYQTVYQGDGNPVYLLDKLEQKDTLDDRVVDIITLKEILKKLSPKERQIISMRYFDDKTQSEIASVVGISQVQVSRIEKKVLNNIRQRFL